MGMIGMYICFEPGQESIWPNVTMEMIGMYI